MTNNSPSENRENSPPGGRNDIRATLDRVAAALEKRNKLDEEKVGNGEKKEAGQGEQANQEKAQAGEGGKDRDAKKKKKKSPVRMLLLIGVPILLVAAFFGYRWWQHASTHEETDDAYVTGHTHQISARVSGTVLEALVDDNWHVRAGQPLVRLDERDYQVAAQRARAQLRQAESQVAQARAAIQQADAEVLQRQAQVSQAEAQMLQAQAQSDIAQINYQRNSSLFQKDLRAIAKQDVDTTKANLDAAQGALNAAKATVEANRASVSAGKSNVENAQAQLETAVAAAEVAKVAVADAELQLSYCQVIAPVDGRIARKAVEAGNRVQVGQGLMAVIEDDVWILANLKETQLEKVQIGQSVQIKVDALPHQTLWGKVDSIQPGTGSNFALLPPDNATGNFIKIVQRVPVKVVFDPQSIKDFRDKIVPGLSTTPSIDVSGVSPGKPGATPITQGSERPEPGVVQ